MEDEQPLDPRIQIELENLNTATDDINKLEIELEEANSTFRILLNESTRRLKLSSKKLGSCIEKARPYHEACEKARLAQIECQKAAVQYQRANEIHAAAKETVALAEERFMSNSHEWQFDGAWQEMLNHATLKVMDAEKTKAESGMEHQNKAAIFNQAEKKVQQLEERFRRSIQKSRPYFEEKQICQDQLQTQKERIQQIQSQLQKAKTTYSTSLRSLEQISEEIHRSRSNKGDLSNAAPSGVREPGVGAEHIAIVKSTSPIGSPFAASLPDFSAELDKCDERSSQCVSMATSSAVSERDPTEGDPNDDLDLEYLRQKVKFLAVRPVESADGQQQDQDIWENELNATVNKLDHLMMMRESATNLMKPPTTMTPTNNFSLPTTPLRSDVTITNNTPVKQQLRKVDPLPLANVNVSMLNVSSISNFSFLPDSWAAQRYGCGDIRQQPAGAKPTDQPLTQNKRKLSLQ